MIVVIGASGFIGTYLVDELLNEDREIVGTGRNPRAREYFESRNVPLIPLDIGKKEQFDLLPRKKVDTVVLLSALVPANVVKYDPQDYVDINLTGTVNTLEYCRKVGASKIINATSHSDVAALWDCSRAITEEDQRSLIYTGDHAVYGITKTASVDLVEHYHQQYGLQGISLRLPAVYGYGPHGEIFVDGKRIVTGFKIFVYNALEGKPIEIWGDCRKLGRDLVYVKDTVACFIGAIDSRTAHGLYNVGTGIRTTLEEEIKAVVKVFCPPGRQSQLIYRPDKPNNIHSYLYDISKAKRDLGYQVKYPLMALVEDYYREMKAQRFPHLIARENKG